MLTNAQTNLILEYCGEMGDIKYDKINIIVFSTELVFIVHNQTDY